MDIKVDKGRIFQNSFEWDIILIGDGIAAQSFLHFLSKENIDKKNILQISANDYFNSCSQNSTSIVCLDGIKEGISPLGDLLFKSYYFFENLIKTSNFNSVYLGKLKVNNQTNDENIEKRYGHCLSEKNNFLLPAWFINAKNFLVELQINQSHKLTQKLDLVTQITEGNTVLEVTTLRSTYLAKVVVLALGKEEKNTKSLINSTPVAGHYLAIDFDLQNIIDQSYVYQYKMGKTNIRLYLRKDENSLMLGSFNQKNEIDLPEIHELFTIYEHVKQQFKDFPLPAFNEWTYKVGIRAKGPRMIPYWGQRAGHQRLFEIKNLYKNGYSFGPLAANEILPEVLSQLN